jgi:hypothetical protein
MRPVAALLVVVLLTQTVGCMSWSQQRPGATAPALVADHPGWLRAELADGRQLDVRHPRVQGDSLLGFAYDNRNYQIPLAVALADVRSVSTRRFSPGKTVLLVPVVAFGFILLAIATWSGD